VINDKVPSMYGTSFRGKYASPMIIENVINSIGIRPGFENAILYAPAITLMKVNESINKSEVIIN
tara:strand:+ start:3763 stop:3957 length:195 start_codon:yes stop_codon:yes gene_type:complete